MIQWELCVPVASVRPHSALWSAAHGILLAIVHSPSQALPLGTACVTVFGAHQHVTTLNSVWRLICSINHLAFSVSWPVAKWHRRFCLGKATRLPICNGVLQMFIIINIIIIIRVLSRIISALTLAMNIWGTCLLHKHHNQFIMARCYAERGIAAYVVSVCLPVRDVQAVIFQ